MDNNQFFEGNIPLDGINFYYPESLYTPGETPLVLWLKPFMIPDILQKPVNDQLAHLHKPHDYTNIYEYCQKLLKKNKTKKKKKNVICDKMELDNLVEVCKKKIIFTKLLILINNYLIQNYFISFYFTKKI